MATDFSVRPKSTLLVIDAKNNLNNPAKAWTRPGGHVVFVVYNQDSRRHVVRIPPDSFKPKPPAGKPKGRKHPIAPAGSHQVTVPANDVAVIRLEIRPKSHFEAGNWSYKYTIYWADDRHGTNEQRLDPQIEINN